MLKPTYIALNTSVQVRGVCLRFDTSSVHGKSREMRRRWRTPVDVAGSATSLDGMVAAGASLASNMALESVARRECIAGPLRRVS